MIRGLFRLALVLAALAAASACSELKDAAGGADASDAATSTDEGGTGDGTGNGSSPDGAPAHDAARPGDDASSPAPPDGGGGGGDAASDARGSTGLDPGVVLPDLGEPVCDRPGEVSCGGVRACRMATPDSGRCDDCYPQDGRCSKLVTQPCARTLDCDVDLQCFRGKCTLTCSLPGGNECGGLPANCIDVGYVGYGLCDPDKLN